jgi:pyruvate dehydrogenase E2 component (dihydrolipoamide acetyltransferase)
MATEITLPALGENLNAGDVLDVRVAPGATVSKGQTLLEIEAEKSTVEVPSPVDGRVTELRVKKGDHVSVGQVLCLIEDGEAGKDGAAKAPVRAAEPATVDEADVQRPANGVGDEHEPRPKAVAAVASKVETAPPVGDGRKPPSQPPPVQQEPTVPGKLVPAGPATRHLARELGVDLKNVIGSAPGGRVTEDDVKAYVRQIASGQSVSGAPVQAPPLPDFERWGPIERKPLEAVRRRTAEQMSLAWSLIPHVTQHDVADITDLDAFRREQDGKGPKLTVTAFALKAVAIALKLFPQFNTSLDAPGGQLVFKRYYHIGVAVDTDRGLLVPAVRDVDKKSVTQLAQELTEIAEKARQKKVSADDMRGGTFTITNLGGIGGTGFTPIVNWPQVAILGLSRSRWEAVVRDGQVVPRLMLPLCVSYDHRVIDGADAARFTRRIAEMLEKPMVMLLHA